MRGKWCEDFGRVSSRICRISRCKRRSHSARHRRPITRPPPRARQSAHPAALTVACRAIYRGRVRGTFCHVDCCVLSSIRFCQTSAKACVQDRGREPSKGRVRRRRGPSSQRGPQMLIAPNQAVTVERARTRAGRLRKESAARFVPWRPRPTCRGQPLQQEKVQLSVQKVQRTRALRCPGWKPEAEQGAYGSHDRGAHGRHDVYTSLVNLVVDSFAGRTCSV